jgi:hypothetical protein
VRLLLKELPHVDLRAFSTICSLISCFFPSLEADAPLPADDHGAGSDPVDGRRRRLRRRRTASRTIPYASATASPTTTRWTASQEAIESDDAVSKVERTRHLLL